MLKLGWEISELLLKQYIRIKDSKIYFIFIFFLIFIFILFFSVLNLELEVNIVSPIGHMLHVTQKNIEDFRTMILFYMLIVYNIYDF